MEIKKFSPVDHKVKAVIYGASWCWKTVFGWTAPNPIFASAEGGLLSIADKQPAFVEIKTLNDLKSLLQYLKTEKHEFETVVIDSISEINDIIKMDIEKKNGRPMAIQDRWTLSKEIKSIFRWFRDLPMHILFIAQESSEKDEDVVVKVVPSLNWKAASEIAYFMDIVWYIYIEKSGERKIITNSNTKLLTKDRTWTIWNDTPCDFSTWIERAKGVKIGEQEVIWSFDEVQDTEPTPAQPEKKKPLPQPAKKAEPVPTITEETAKEVFASWDKMRELSMKKTPDEKDSLWNIKYTRENSDWTRKKTMLELYKVDSSKKLSQEQWKDFAQKLKTKIEKLEKMPDAVTEPVEPEATTTEPDAIPFGE